MCLDDSGHEVSLRQGTVYQVVKPLPGDRARELRVIDDEGEDYVYPANRFTLLKALPPRAKRAVKEASKTAT